MKVSNPSRTQVRETYAVKLSCYFGNPSRNKLLQLRKFSSRPATKLEMFNVRRLLMKLCSDIWIVQFCDITSLSKVLENEKHRITRPFLCCAVKG